MLELSIAGCPFRIASTRAEVLSALGAAWRPALADLRARRAIEVLVGAGDEILVNGVPWNGALDVHDATPRVEQLFFERVFARYPNACALHAGVVKYGGKLVVLVGASGAGKSSLTREFLKLGATYSSDDLVLLDGAIVRGIARSVQFDPIPLEEDVPGYLVDCDVDSYRAGLGRQKAFKIPLWRGEFPTLSEISVRELEEVVVVRITRGDSDSLEAKAPLDRTTLLHEAALASRPPYGGELGTGATYFATWTTPAGLARLIANSLG